MSLPPATLRSCVHFFSPPVFRPRISTTERDESEVKKDDEGVVSHGREIAFRQERETSGVC